MYGTYNEDEKKAFIKKFKSDMRKSGYMLTIVNTYTGQNWDSRDSKIFEVYYVSYNEKGKPFIKQLRANHILCMGFEWNKVVMTSFYCGALGVSRAMLIANAISRWVYGAKHYNKLNYNGHVYGRS